MLIEHDADVTTRTGQLHYIWRHVRDVSCMLIEHGADVTAQNKDGET
jgi:hypothetical protein